MAAQPVTPPWKLIDPAIASVIRSHGRESSAARPGRCGGAGERPGAVASGRHSLPFHSHSSFRQRWMKAAERGVGCAGSKSAGSDKTLVDVAPCPLRSWLQTAGERVVGLRVVRLGVLVR